MNVSRKQPITVVTSQPPVHRIMVDGEVVEEKVTKLYNRKMVTPSGTVIRLALATGATVPKDSAGNPYGAALLPQKMRQGSLLYAECPYATGALKVPPGVTPCKGTNPDHPGAFWSINPGNRNRYVEDECCEHIEAIIKRRTEAHTKKQAEFSEQFTSAHELVARAELAKAKERLEDATPNKGSVARSGKRDPAQ